MSEMIKGAWDCHVHTSPDVVARKATDYEMAKQWSENGMAGGIIKCHYADTTGRAALLRTIFPEMKIYGGLVLNKQAGGLNPDAVLRMAQAGGKYLWFPTMESKTYMMVHHKNSPTVDYSGFLSVCDAEGKLLPQVYEILDIAAKYDLVVGTGHIGQAETIPLVKEAFKRGVKKVVLTHAENPNTWIEEEVQKELVAMGAMVEHSFFTIQFNRIPWETMVSQIRAVGTANVIPVTDFGQMNSPYSFEGLETFMKGLLEHGFTQDEVDEMFKKNPEKLFG